MLFISHRNADKQFALDLLDRAKQRGYEERQLFLDSDPDAGIPAGSDWEQVIYEKLKQYRALVVIYSSRWNEPESKWCFAELVTAKTLGKLVFPVVIEDIPIHPLVSDRQAVWPCREGDKAFERLWKALEETGLSPYDTRPWPPLDKDGKPTDPCPYPGLMAFSERFAPVYFGRDPETAEALAELNKMRDRGEPRLLMIVGGSGSGKSSLLRAGVLPRLNRNRDWQALPTLRYGQARNDDLSLLALLAQELAARFPADSPTRPDWKDLRGKLESEDVEQAARDFFEVNQDLNFALGYRDATTLLAIDQFEELFAVDQSEERLATAIRPSAERFLRFMHALLAKNNGRLLVIGTLRSDYLDVYERHRHALQKPFLETYRLPPFPWERVTDVIIQPAARVGVTFTNELLERLKRDAPTSDALPLLAFTLEKLFRECAADGQIELGEYDALGGMTGAIERAVKEIVPARLSLEIEQALRLSFVRNLVQLNEKDEFVRRPARWSDLPAAARPLLEKFVSARLLHTSGESEAVTVEVSHEALFRCWPALVEWLKVSSRVLRWRRDVERDRRAYRTGWRGLKSEQFAVSRRWPREIADELSPDEITWIHQARRNQRLFRGAVSAVVLIIAFLAAAAYWQAGVARERERLAESRRLAALSEITKPDQLPVKMLLAVEATLAAETREARHSLQRALTARPEVARYYYLPEFETTHSVACGPNGRVAVAANKGVVVFDQEGSQLLPVPEGRASSVAFEPSGRIAAGFSIRSKEEKGRGGDFVGGVVIFNTDGTRSNSGVLTVPEGEVHRVAFGPDGRIAAAFRMRRENATPFEIAKGGVVVFDADGSRAKHGVLAVPEGEITSVAVGTNGRIAVGYKPERLSRRGGGVVVFGADGTRAPAKPLIVPENDTNSLAFGPGARIAAGFSRVVGVYQQGGVALFEADGKAVMPKILDVPEGGVNSVAFGPDGRIAAGFIIGKELEGVAVFNPDGSRAQPGILAVPEGQVTGVDVATNGHIVVGFSRRVSGGGAFTNGGGVLVFDPAGARLRSKLLAVGNGRVESVAFGPRGRIAALVRGPVSIKGDASKTPDSSRRATGVVEMFDADGARLLKEPLAVVEGEITSFDFDVDGRIVVGLRLGSAGGVAVFEVDGTRAKPGILTVPEGAVESVACGPGGRIAAAFVRWGERRSILNSGVVVFDADNERAKRRVFTTPAGEVVGVAFGPNGRVAAGFRPRYGECNVVVFDAGGEGAPVEPLDPIKENPAAIAFGADGRIAVGLRRDVMGGAGNRLEVFNAGDTPPQRKHFEVPEGWVTGLAFGPGGRIATYLTPSSNRAGGLIVFDEYGTRVLAEPLAVAGGGITSVAFAADGRIAAGFSADSHRGTDSGVAIFDIDINSWKRKAVQTANRNFTRIEWMRFFPGTPYRRTSRSLPWPHDLPENER